MAFSFLSIDLCLFVFQPTNDVVYLSSSFSYYFQMIGKPFGETDTQFYTFQSPNPSIHSIDHRK